MMPDYNDDGQLKWTNDNLREIVSPLIACWLIEAAEQRSTMTYGEARTRLMNNHGFGKPYTDTRLGWPAGELMGRLHDQDKGAPLLNTLLVRQDDGMPGEGAGEFFSQHFNDRKMGIEGAREQFPKRWKRYTSKAAEEVFAYKEWRQLYEATFSAPMPKARYLPNQPSEKDGINYGRSGEGAQHKALRLWVRDNPQLVAPWLDVIESETEFQLESGDRVDVVYKGRDATIAIEVKSIKSNIDDLKRGVYQCVKYDAVLRATDPRKKPNIIAVLVTEEPLTGYLSALCNRLGHAHILISPDRSKVGKIADFR